MWDILIISPQDSHNIKHEWLIQPQDIEKSN